MTLCRRVACSSIVYTQIDLIEFCAPKNGTFGTLQMLLTQEVDAVFGPVCCAGTHVFSIRSLCVIPR